MNEVIDGSLASRRFSAELVGVFAVVALLLASVGIYGLLAYMAGQRAHEIGVRMALGAMPSTIGKMIVSRGAGLAGVGVGGGLILSRIMAPPISSLLDGVRPLDPEVFIAVPLILMLIVLSLMFTGPWSTVAALPRCSEIAGFRRRRRARWSDTPGTQALCSLKGACAVRDGSTV
jgi:ABC-type antimicrobial peptide transport system permease subunit